LVYTGFDNAADQSGNPFHLRTVCSLAFPKEASLQQ